MRFRKGWLHRSFCRLGWAVFTNQRMYATCIMCFGCFQSLNWWNVTQRFMLNAKCIVDRWLQYTKSVGLRSVCFASQVVPKSERTLARYGFWNYPLHPNLQELQELCLHAERKWFCIFANSSIKIGRRVWVRHNTIYHKRSKGERYELKEESNRATLKSLDVVLRFGYGYSKCYVCNNESQAEMRKCFD